jgi:hypothetical protein
MKDLDTKFFRVYNMDYGRMYENFQQVSLGDAQKRMQDFFKRAGDGSYRVVLYKTNGLKANGQPKEEGFEYEVIKSASLQDDKPQQKGMMGMDFNSGYMGAVDMPTHLASQDQIMELRLQLLSKENEIARLQDRLEDLQRKHEQDLASAKNPQELIKQVAPSILGAVQGLDLSSFGKKPQAPMNGVDTMEKPTNTQNKQALMVQAVNKLINLDPNFSDNICKLAELAERNPTVYKMAVNQLNSL